MRGFFIAALFLAPIILSLGCGGDPIEVTRVPKESAPSESAQAALPDTPRAEEDNAPMAAPAATTAASEVAWKAPSGWKEEPASGMRRASFSVQGDDGLAADVSVVNLPGSAGGLLQNINRWREQIALPPLSEKELASHLQKTASAAGTVQWVDFVSSAPLEGKHKRRVLAAVLEQSGQSWFFKMSGDDPAVAAGRPDFIRFLESLRPR
ncbi:MAG: hypothetical protein HY611_04085 [Elusimicrobia bacterium]|nr:hypothetical protein [Elusimicrobiota bacterium]